MKTFYGSETFTNIAKENKIFLTLGSYDGIHIGHQKIINTLIKKAIENNAKTAVLTYEPHPRIFFKKNIKLINTLEEKLMLFNKFNIDYCIIDTFDQEYANILPENFINEILLNRINAKYIVVGYDHHFGKNRKGNFQLLKKLLSPKGILVEKIPEVKINGKIISSSEIRKLILAGNITEANKFLGYNFFISGKVIEGKKLGRTIGFPTANLLVENPYKIIPKSGVYATFSIIDGVKFPSMTNIGTAPTLKNDKITIETHVLHFSKNIYNKSIQVEFIQFVREEKKFSSVNELINQLNSDKVIISEILKNYI